MLPTWTFWKQGLVQSLECQVGTRSDDAAQTPDVSGVRRGNEVTHGRLRGLSGLVFYVFHRVLTVQIVDLVHLADPLLFQSRQRGFDDRNHHGRGRGVGYPHGDEHGDRHQAQVQPAGTAPHL